ncbi:MAG: sugar transferase [Acidimicrobiales bacterium]
MTRGPQLLLTLGVFTALLGFGAFHASVVDGSYRFVGDARFPISLAYGVALLLVAYALGLPDLPRTRKSRWFTAVAASFGGAIVLSLVQLALGTPLLPRFVVFSSAFVLVPWFLICAEAATGGRRRAVERDRVVVVSDRASASELEREFADAERPASLVALLTVDEATGATGSSTSVSGIVEALGANIVVLDREAQADPRIVDQAAALHIQGIRIRTLSLFYEQWFNKLPISELERVSLLFDIGELHRSPFSRLKRLMDICVASAGLPVLLAVIPMVVIGNRFANRGPLLFRQVRVGHMGTEIAVLKFRSMRPDPNDDQSWTQTNDPRITPFGGFLRASHLDELPQLINILRNELSLVGPRPEQRRYVDELSGKLPFYELRHLVRPGLTGWAQVKAGYAADEDDALEKLQYEFYYLRQQSLSFDLQILIRTLRSLFLGDGR